MSGNVQEIVLTKEIVEAIAQAAADIVKTQLALDDRVEIAPDQLDKLADKISTRLDSAVDYDRIKSEVKRGLPAPSFKNYELTDQDRYDIAQNVLTGLDLSEDIRDTLARNFVSKAFFNQNIANLKQFVSDNKGRVINAGIAGKDMIEEINKILGTDWQGGGAGGDMLKSVYDSNDDGKVNEADAADSVPWDGVTDKPAIGDMLSPGSASVGEVPVADSTDGKQTAYTSVLIDKTTGKMTFITTQQVANHYMQQDREIVITHSGLDTGVARGRFGVTSASLFRIRIGSGNSLVFTASETQIEILKKLILSGIPSGATQVAAGAAANEVWKTSGHATLPDNVLLIGV